LTSSQAKGTGVDPQPTSSYALVARLYRGHIRRHLAKLSFAAVCMTVVAAATAANA